MVKAYDGVSVSQELGLPFRGGVMSGKCHVAKASSVVRLEPKPE
jgi:hypothetical protein